MNNLSSPAIHLWTNCSSKICLCRDHHYQTGDYSCARELLLSRSAAIRVCYLTALSRPTNNTQTCCATGTCRILPLSPRSAHQEWYKLFNLNLAATPYPLSIFAVLAPPDNSHIADPEGTHRRGRIWSSTPRACGNRPGHGGFWLCDCVGSCPCPP